MVQLGSDTGEGLIIMQLKTRNPKIMLLKGFFYDKDQPKYIAAKVGSITENINKNVAFAYLGKAKSYNEEIFKKVPPRSLKKRPGNTKLTWSLLLLANVSERLIVNNFVHLYNFDRAKLFSLKTQKTQAKPTLELVNVKEKKVHNTRKFCPKQLTTPATYKLRRLT
ncbi:hypothetical protein [Mycoplasma sp. ATU-Cv-508]|uniref:hypothetical protein n=1 Tax=Mycoplasma sp. ATU-Cv-508 TaxID=2048001 RepID=UPI001F20B7AF